MACRISLRDYYSATKCHKCEHLYRHIYNIFYREMMIFPASLFSPAISSYLAEAASHRHHHAATSLSITLEYSFSRYLFTLFREHWRRCAADDCSYMLRLNAAPTMPPQKDKAQVTRSTGQHMAYLFTSHSRQHNTLNRPYRFLITLPALLGRSPLTGFTKFAVITAGEFMGSTLLLSHFYIDIFPPKRRAAMLDILLMRRHAMRIARVSFWSCCRYERRCGIKIFFTLKPMILMVTLR